MSPRIFWVYVLANSHRTIYVGVTADLFHRLEEHRSGHSSRFVARHRLHRLVYAEPYPRALDAIHREKQLKGWTRERKIRLIESANPNWCDWFALPLQPKKK